MHVTADYLIFDLDDTLYSPACGLKEVFSQRIDLFLRDRLGFDAGRAARLKQRYFEDYGLTGKGLEIHHHVDFREYLEFIHNIPLERFVRPDGDLAAALDAIDCVKVLFTNSILSHARRILDILGLEGSFRDIFTIESFDFINKPRELPYRKLLSALNVRSNRCVYLDDSVRNLMPARRMGMQTVLVHPREQGLNADYVLDDIHQIGHLWDRLQRPFRSQRHEETPLRY